MKKKNIQEKGITLVALVITIILLLILAGVTLSILINTGLIGNTQKSVDMYKIQEYKEKIDIITSGEIIRKKRDHLEEKLKDLVVEQLRKEDWVSFVKTNEDEESLDENQIQVLTKDNYIIIAEILEDGTIKYIVIEKYDGEPYPIITIQQLEETENEKVKIKVIAEVTPTKETKNIQKIELKQNNTVIETKEYTEQNKSKIEDTFEIEKNKEYVITATTNKNKSSSKKVIIKGEKIKITIDPETPRNTQEEGEQNGIKTGPIIATIDFGETEHEKEYKIGDGDWEPTTDKIVTKEIIENTTITARYVIGTSYSSTTEVNIVNVDNVAPTMETIYTEVDKEKITIKPPLVRDNASPKAGPDINGATTTYSIDGKNYYESNEFIVDEAGTYTIYARAIDKAGNMVEKTTTVRIPEGFAVAVVKEDGINSVTNSKILFEWQENFEITATVSEGCKFDKWKIIAGTAIIDDEKSATTTITPTSDVTVFATAILPAVVDNLAITEGATNKTLTGKDFSYNNPVIPVGFKAVDTDEAKWKSTDGIKVDDWNKGLVIEDKDENQFVWIPVHNEDIVEENNTIKNVPYTKWCTSGIAWNHKNIKGDEIPEEVTNIWEQEEISQIEKYHGFYIGRYEAGIPEDATEAINQTSTTYRNKTDIGNPISKQNVVPWDCINYANAKINAENMVNNNFVKSGLLTGTMWDTVMKWIENSGEDVIENSKMWGNYHDSEVENVTVYSTNKGTYWTSTIPNIIGNDGSYYLLKTGNSKFTKRKNIYDLAGNVKEITSELYGTIALYRGGAGSNYGDKSPAAVRYNNGVPQSYQGFRCALYIKSTT